MPAPAEATAVAPGRRLTFGAGAWNDLAADLDALDAGRLVFAVGSGLPREAGEAAVGLPRALAPVTVCEVAPGEEDKAPGAVTRMMARAPGGRITRNPVAVAEGGQAGNIAGLTAARLHRGGIRLFRSPPGMPRCAGLPFMQVHVAMVPRAIRATEAAA